MKIPIQFLWILLALIPNVIHSQITILSPPKLQEWWKANSASITTSVGTFGYIPWGEKVMGSVKLAEPIDACDYLRQEDNYFINRPVLVATRGKCPFVVKARYAQLAGAQMLLIVDTATENVVNSLMVDSTGQGGTFNIPSVMISKLAGEKLVDFLKSPDSTISTISIVFDFQMQKSNNVEYHLWLSSSTGLSFKLVNEWRQYEQRLHSFAKMIPSYAHHRIQAKEHAKEENCLCKGRYCAPDPDDVRNNTGVDVILEDLRQLCILKEYSQEAWWDYMAKYDTYCLTAGDMNLCSKSFMQEMGLDYNLLQKCVNATFDTKNHHTCNSNKVLDEQENQMLKVGISYFPSVSINGYPFRGNLHPATGLFEAICESFKDMPNVCKQSLNIPLSPPSRIPVIISAVAFLLLFTLFVFCCYSRFLKRDMYRQMVRNVNIAVSQYEIFKDHVDEDEENKGISRK